MLVGLSPTGMAARLAAPDRITMREITGARPHVAPTVPWEHRLDEVLQSDYLNPNYLQCYVTTRGYRPRVTLLLLHNPTFRTPSSYSTRSAPRSWVWWDMPR